jgi:hypothetical protein
VLEHVGGGVIALPLSDIRVLWRWCALSRVRVLCVSLLSPIGTKVTADPVVVHVAKCFDV